MYVSHPLIKPNTIEVREYQKNIINTAKDNNTLVVLPTGIGKTIIAVLLAAERLYNHRNTKALVLAPTKPLAAQHQKTFQKTFIIPKEHIVLLTGHVPAEKRREMYRYAKVISATPQTIQNDISNNILDLSDFSLLVVDECHRSVKRYAYPNVAKAYKEKSKHPRILGLTASPSSDENKIKEICRNLFIEAVEIRSESDEDVQPYIKPVEIEIIRVNLTESMKRMQKDLKDALKKRMDALKKYHIRIYRKKDLLDFQKKIINKLKVEKKPLYFHMLSSATEAIKIWYALELLETQSISAFRKYIEKIKEKSPNLLKDENIKNVILELIDIKEEHPKMKKLKEVIKRELSNNRDIKIIIFSHYRNNIKKINKELKDICNPVMLIGQKEGLSQKEQIETIKNYEDGIYNCLITSPVGEEGLHLASADLAVFYDSVPSEIRTIQRRGRVGRVKIGRIKILLARGTRDEAYYYTARRKERKMKKILKNMQGIKKTTLKDFL